MFSSPFVERCRVLAYDHRGLGRSTTGSEPPTMADFAGDLLRLLDHVGWDTCRAVGISFGGMVLMEAAVTQPERFERCVLGCTSPGGAGGASFPLHELVGLPDARIQWFEGGHAFFIEDRTAYPAMVDFVT